MGYVWKIRAEDSLTTLLTKNDNKYHKLLQIILFIDKAANFNMKSDLKLILSTSLRLSYSFIITIQI